MRPTTDPTSQVSLTSLAVAAHRAIETERPGALFADPHARLLAGADGFRVADELAATSSFPLPPPTPGMFAVRTRFFDDAIAEAMRRPDIRQVVALGAGMDTRAFRMAWPAATHLYEIDRGNDLAYKEALLRACGATARCTRSTVHADLATNWAPALLASAFEPERPTVWVAEGILYFFDDVQLRRLLDQITSLSAAASVLLADVAPAFVRDLHQLQPWRDLLEAYGEPFRSFVDDGAALLAVHGWTTHTATSIAQVARGLGYDYPAVGMLGARRLLAAQI